MKLSEQTIAIFKHYSQINPGIQVRPGNSLVTVSPVKTIFAKAVVPDEFEQEFTIYNLPRFLGTLSLFSDPNLDFKENYVVISSGKQRVTYAYADPSMIVQAPQKEIKFPESIVTFNLKNEDLQQILKAGAVLGSQEVAISGDGEVINISAVNAKNSSDTFSIEVGSTDKQFKTIFPAQNLKLLPKDYEVSLTAHGISRFVNDDITFWVAADAK